MKEPKKGHLVKIIAAHLGQEMVAQDNEENLKQADLDELVDNFIEQRYTETLANDQLLNALFILTKTGVSTKDKLIKQILQDLGQVNNEEDEE